MSLTIASVENSFVIRRAIAYQEEQRIEAAEKAGARKRVFRGIRTIYHDEFPPYFAWVVAKIPLVKRHDTFELHLNYYGIPLKLYEVEAYLEELLGKKFEILFGFDAGRAEYQYLDDVLAMGLNKPGAEAEDAGIEWLNLSRARAWLAEQIVQAKKAPITPVYTSSSADENPSDTQTRQFYSATDNVAAWEAASILAQPVDSTDYDISHTTAEAQQSVAENKDSLFGKLLRGYSLVELTTLLLDLNLIDKDERATASASPGAWVGVIYALLDEKRPRIRGSKAAIQRAFGEVFGATVDERTVQAGITKNSNEAADVKARALLLLSK